MNEQNNSENRVNIPEVNKNEPLDQKTALNILVNAIYVGQSRGAWKLEESEVLSKAVKAFVQSGEKND